MAFPSLSSNRAVSTKLLVPANGVLIEIDEHLLGLEILLEAPWAQLSAEAGLLIAAPWRFDVSRLHMIHPDNSGAQRFHNAERLVNVACPHGAGEAIRGIVGDADGIGFVFEGNHGSDGPKDFLSGDARLVVHIIENRRLHIVALAEALRTPAADRRLGFLLANL